MDRSILTWIVEHRVGALDPLFVALGLVGYAGLVWIALAAPIASLGRLRPLRAVGTTAVTVWSADLLTLGIKAAVGRPRPFEALPDVEPLVRGTVGSSLPSGHAATSFAGAVLLSLLLPRAAPLLLCLATAIAFSRVYAGVHYPGDVLVGAAVGTACALVAIAAVRARRWLLGVQPRSGAGPPPG